MKDSIHLQMMRFNSNNTKYYNEMLKKITRLWFKLCEKYNLVLNITFYNFKSKKRRRINNITSKKILQNQ